VNDLGQLMRRLGAELTPSDDDWRQFIAAGWLLHQDDATTSELPPRARSRVLKGPTASGVSLRQAEESLRNCAVRVVSDESVRGGLHAARLELAGLVLATLAGPPSKSAVWNATNRAHDLSKRIVSARGQEHAKQGRRNIRHDARDQQFASWLATEASKWRSRNPKKSKNAFATHVLANMPGEWREHKRKSPRALLEWVRRKHIQL
jgi:hypothetical protein